MEESDSLKHPGLANLGQVYWDLSTPALCEEAIRRYEEMLSHNAHVSLENNCAACHTSVAGVESSQCILCHAKNQSLLQGLRLHARLIQIASPAPSRFAVYGEKPRLATEEFLTKPKSMNDDL